MKVELETLPRVLAVDLLVELLLELVLELVLDLVLELLPLVELDVLEPM